MLFFRTVFALLLLGSMACFAAYVGTGRILWRQRGLVILKWTVLAALGFFAVLIVQRLVELA
jgi:hypothetical protein